MKFPWLYLLFGRGYFNSLKIARRCPEIRPLMHRRARAQIAGCLWLIPVVLVLGIPALLVVMGEWIDRTLRHIRLPTWKHFGRARDLLHEIHTILPPKEIRKRLED